MIAIGPTPCIAASSPAPYVATCSSVVTPASRSARVAGAPIERGQLRALPARLAYARLGQSGVDDGLAPR